MVIEMLSFDVAAADLEAWLRADDEVWTTFLAQQPGFVRKERWIDEAGLVHAVIWWSSRADWKSIERSTVDDVDARMGDLRRPATCRVFDVV